MRNYILLLFLLTSCFSSNQDGGNFGTSIDSGNETVPVVGGVETINSDSDTGGVEVYGYYASIPDYFSFQEDIFEPGQSTLRASFLSLKVYNYNQDLYVKKINFYNPNNQLLNFTSNFPEISDSDPSTQLNLSTLQTIEVDFSQEVSIDRVEFDLSYKNRNYVLFSLVMHKGIPDSEPENFYIFNKYHFNLDKNYSGSASFKLINKKCTNPEETIFPDGECHPIQKVCPPNTSNQCAIFVGGFQRNCVILESASKCLEEYPNSKVCSLASWLLDNPSELVSVRYNQNQIKDVQCSSSLISR
jgi:hypothetical protein